MSFVTVSDGARLYYEDYGSGRPVIFLHGWALSGTFFRRQFHDLSSDCRIIAIDQRGQGNSSVGTEGSPTIDLMARDLRDIIEILDLRRVVLVGCPWEHSLCGSTAICVAMRIFRE